MKFYFHYFAFLFVMISGCKFVKSTKVNGNYKAFEFVSRIQYVDLETLTVQNFDDSVIVFYGNDGSRIFRLPFSKVSFTSEKTDSGLVFSEVDAPPVIGYKYFYIKPNQRKGKLFSDSLILLDDNVSADSVYERAISFPKRIINPHNTIMTKTLERDGFIEERYFAKIKPDETFADSIYLNYDKSLKQFSFTFSDSIDKAKDSKLSKIIYVYNSYFNNKLNIQVPKRKIQFQIRLFQGVDTLPQVLFRKEQ